MKLHFDSNLDYQLDAINAVVDVFAGQIKSDSSVIGGQAELGLEGQQLSLEATSARGNILSLTKEQIVKNTRAVQERNDIVDAKSDDLNFSIEMETGTGKTIVVPSVAIREGVLKNLEITREHFDELYHKPETDPYVWDSKKTGQAREFATNDTLQIMVITIDSFTKAANIMNKQSDYGRPLDFVRATNPVVIVDEPQNMETEVRKAAIESLNPLCTLRYSATHKIHTICSIA